jgi:hypothetical protein
MVATLTDEYINALPLELASNITVCVDVGTPPLAGPPLVVDQLLALLHELVPVATQ